MYHSLYKIEPSEIYSLLSFKNRNSSLIDTLRGSTVEEKLNNLWLKMQITINSIFDSSLDNRASGRVAKGIRQVSLLKKLSRIVKHLHMFITGHREKRRSISYAYDG